MENDNSRYCIRSIVLGYLKISLKICPSYLNEMYIVVWATEYLFLEMLESMHFSHNKKLTQKNLI